MSDAATTLACPRCAAVLTPGDRFCADCGARIGPPDLPSHVLAPGARAEAAGPGLAGQTDSGITHRTNQDAFALSGPPEGGPGTVLVLCDGVSNSQTPDLAAAAAARVAHDHLLANGPAAMAEAIRAAHAAVCALPFDRQSPIDPPATTIIAAVLGPGGATIGWLGDSRAYALDPSPDPAASPGQQLTRDHSWLALVTGRGEMTEADALRDPRAHALVHCLGTTDFARPIPCPEPSVIHRPLPPGWLLLCSDGLWNYAPTPATLAAAASEGLRTDAPDLCARLIDFARHAGGHDNITVLAARTG